MSTPVVLVHGWGGSFEATWQRSGFTELLADAGREVIGVDLLGHGEAPKPHDPAAYADLTTRIVDVLPDEPVDAVGFSLGAMTLLRLAVQRPERVPSPRARRASGATCSSATTSAARASSPASRAPPIRTTTRPGCSASTPASPATTGRRWPRCCGDATRAWSSPRTCRSSQCPVLVVIGDRDFAGPADQLVDALPDARLVVLRNTDHFATPESFGFIDAVLEFLEAVPA